MKERNCPLFSIIVPVYRVEEYLDQCMASVLGQSWEDFEVILVDDGSPDRCGALCDGYAAQDGRVQVIHKENGGLVSARKAGAEQCTGAYVVNVDSDDYIATDLLERLADIISRHQPEVITYDGYQFSGKSQWEFGGTLPAGLYEGQKLETVRRNVIQNDDNENAILYGICLKAIRRELYLKYQLPVPERISTGEDLAMTGPLLTQCSSVYISDIRGYFYRMNPQSIMNTFRRTEVDQIRYLADHLDQAMGGDYTGRVDTYVLLHCFDFLDRAMLTQASMADFCRLAKETMTEPLQKRMNRAVCTGGRAVEKLIFLLMRRRAYHLLWLLRHIKPRQ